MTKPQASTDVRKTPDFDFVFGSFNNGQTAIPYFSVSMSFSDASQYLRLVNDMPGASRMEWRVEELFQRDIDWKRVDTEIVPYLKQTENPNFFNSITIALLPIGGDGVRDFADGSWAAPTLGIASGMAKTLNTGPVSIGYWNDWEDLSEPNARIGQIAWNYEQVAAVAIDGQHRLAAIKSASSLPVDSKVPVILLLLSGDLGYRSAKPLLSTLRQLFIDLNKHAKTVKRARQILLDDLEVTSVCVRSLVGPQLTRGCNEIEGDLPRLSLALVDWHSEQARFDEGPYLTTILGLDFAVSTLLQTKATSRTAYGKIRSEIRNLSRILGVDLSSAMTRLEDARKFQRTFSYDDGPGGELDRIREAFQKYWNLPIVIVLTEFRPYRALIERRIETDTCNPEFENWYSVKEDVRRTGEHHRPLSQLSELVTELANRTDDPISEEDLESRLKEIEGVKKQGWGLAFNVVFQRALFIALDRLTKLSDREIPNDEDEEQEVDIEDLLEADGDVSEDGVEQVSPTTPNNPYLLRARMLVHSLNSVIASQPDFLDTSHDITIDPDDPSARDLFWIGSIVDPASRSIDFTQSASIRASDLIVMAPYIKMYKDAHPDADFEGFWTDATRGTSGLLGKLRSAIGRLKNGVGPNKSVAARTLDARSLNPDDDAGRSGIIKPRIGWIWNAVS